MKVTKEQVAEAIKYLDEIEKGKDDMDLSSEVNGGDEEDVQSLKSEMLNLVKKAKTIQDKISKLEKAKKVAKGDEELEEEDEELEEEDEELEEEDEGEEVEKGCHKIKKSSDKKSVEEKFKFVEGKSPKKKVEPELDNEEIKKSIKNDILEEFKFLIEDKDETISLLKSKLDDLSSKIEEIQNTPIRKSFVEREPIIKDRFKKARDEGKTVISKDIQKSIVSDHIFKLFEDTSDELEKSRISNAIVQFESAGYLDEYIQKQISEKYNIEIL